MPRGFTKDRIEIAFRAYEGDATVVDNLIRDLWRHAKEMEPGVRRLYPERMFRDMAAGAQLLYVLGAGTDRVMPFIRIFSRLVRDGITTYEEIAKAVGRCGALGRIRKDEYDALKRAGCTLPKWMRAREIAVSWDDLLGMIDRAIREPTTTKGGA